jgi:DNA ligase-1
VDLSIYLISEKFDGVRAVWMNGQLTTRSGLPIQAPGWMTEALPDQNLEGELWLGYGRFDDVSGLARSAAPEDPLWHDVQFLVFDLPGSGQPFQKRVTQIEELVQVVNRPWFKSIPREEISSEAGLKNRLEQIVAKGGEGLMLNDRNANYVPARTNAILKYKPVFDDEAVVIEVIEGKGKYAGKMGSLQVKLKNGRLMKIGSGFTDALRNEPPQPGEWITIEYSGYTSTGLPRFARFKRRYYAQ